MIKTFTKTRVKELSWLLKYNNMQWIWKNQGYYYFFIKASVTFQNDPANSFIVLFKNYFNIEKNRIKNVI